MNYSKLTKCRVCGNTNLLPAINIGDQYLSSVFPESLDYVNKLQKYSLDLVMCEKTNETCGVIQTAYEYDLTEMYNLYPYRSAVNKAMVKILEDVVLSGTDLVDIRDNDLVLDIGANDLTLLSFFDKFGCDLLAIDAAKVDPVYATPGLTNIQGKYFDAAVFDANCKGKKAKLIFAIAMLYHLADPMTFLTDIEKCLSEDGVFIAQLAYLPKMISTNMLDNICHEHKIYYGLVHLDWMVKNMNLEIFDVEENDTYGGSFRIFFKNRSNKTLGTTTRYLKMLDKELEDGIYNLSTYQAFEERIDKAKDDLLKLLRDLKAKDKKIWAFSASTKGNTILQYYGIDDSLIEAAGDASSFKVGKFSIGSNIPIKSEQDMRNAAPDYLLSLPYSFTPYFMEKEAELVKNGTRFIIPLPNVKILPE